MTSPHDRVYLSRIDEKRFGVIVAKSLSVTSDTLPSIIKFCLDKRVSLLIARCLTSEVNAVHEMEKQGFLLMDTLVYYKCDIQKKPAPSDDSPNNIRLIRPGEEEQVRDVAAKAFKGYFGHYQADERLDRASCDDIYIDWAYRSCISKDCADAVFVAELDDKIAGLATLRINGPDEVEGILFGVSPAVHGRGIYRSFMISGMIYCKEKGRKNLIVSTQIINLAVQKVWTRLGFEPSRSFYTFHKWFKCKNQLLPGQSSSLR